MKLDRQEPHPGYWPSPWPVECGGNRRQKAARGRLDASGEARVRTRHNGRWNVMIVRRDPGAWYLQGTMSAFSGPAPFGWVERIDPHSLAPLASSPELPCGDHVWCGSILAHADGSLVTVNGNFMHRLGPDCELLVERQLPVDRAHNGLLALSDGTLATKDLRLEGQGPSTLTLLAAGTLEVVGEPFVLPEGSMGRIASDRSDGVDRIYIAGTEHLFRLAWDGERLELDERWKPRYRSAGGDQGLAWDSCLSQGSVWLMDNGDITSVREIFGTHPNGRLSPEALGRLSWRLPAPWSGAQRLVRVSCQDPDDRAVASPFGKPGGGIIAPPVHVPEQGITVMWDSLNGGIAGLHADGDGYSTAWIADARPSMQPVVFPESGELVINDFTEAGSDDLVVIDLETGGIKSRAATGATVANGMFLTAGDDRDVYYCTSGTLARVSWGSGP